MITYLFFSFFCSLSKFSKFLQAKDYSSSFLELIGISVSAFCFANSAKFFQHGFNSSFFQKNFLENRHLNDPSYT